MSLKLVARNRLVAAVAAPMLIGALTACDTSTDPLPPGSTFFVLNAGPTFNSAQARADQTNLGTALAFGPTMFNGSFHIRESEDGPTEFSFRNGTDTTALAVLNFTVPRDSVYLLVMTQRADGGGLLLFRNDVPTFPTTQALLRIVNVAPALGTAPTIGGPVDLYILSQTDDLATAVPDATNIPYEGSSPRIPFTPPTDSVRVVVTRSGTKDVVVEKTYGTRNISGDLFAGSASSIFIINNRTTKVGPVEQFLVLGL
jgi:hypothetical protein